MEDILAENSHMMIVNKPAGCHSSEWAKRHAAAPRQDWECAHRLDFATSGCLLIAAPDQVANYIHLFRSHSTQTRKRYLAEASREIRSGERKAYKGWIVQRYRRSKKVSYFFEPPREGQHHSTREVEHLLQKTTLSQEEKAALGFGDLSVEVLLKTGARHQIRAFFAALNAPLIGDQVYGGPPGKEGLHLHALELEIEDPLDGKMYRATAKQRLIDSNTV